VIYVTTLSNPSVWISNWKFGRSVIEGYQMTVLVLLVCVKFTCDYSVKSLKSCNCDYAFSFSLSKLFRCTIALVRFLLYTCCFHGLSPFRPYQENNNHPSKQIAKYCLSDDFSFQHIFPVIYFRYFLPKSPLLNSFLVQPQVWFLCIYCTYPRLNSYYHVFQLILFYELENTNC
jgi:hypothetical protein